ncbi:MAG: LPS export ABC transporter periplasmic protein LptC [Nitrospira sp.]|nr:LPS export ABC transporter periplasmic protein LptC [Nitrospira sp.]MBS0154342.1 LPS export ABC transporter periplasmic protein LptC [Nitrospira sp.]MBS0165778.1 LPS export ABC transporter periplasmic protein LptC [Nitrospira sp.]
MESHSNMWEIIARRALLSLSVLLTIFLGYLLFRNTASPPSSGPSSFNTIDEADAKLGEFTFTQSKGEAVEWQVRAKQARLFDQEKRAVLHEVVLTFYGGSGDEVTVQGEEGTFNTATKDFVLANHESPIVVQTKSGYTIYTNRLEWVEAVREIRTSAPVRIVGHGLEVRGQGLMGRIPSEEFEILQDVHVDLVSAS